MEKIRLQKYIADCGLMSRRAAEKEIESGLLTINGHPAELGSKVEVGVDIVTYKGKRIVPKIGHSYTYIMINKPRGYVCTSKDPNAEKTVLDLIPTIKERVYPVGRLDKLSEGLLLLTDDGDLTNKLTHPSHKIPKIYRVKVDGQVTLDQLDILTSPLTIDDYTIKPVDVDVFKVEQDTTTLTFRLLEGRNRQIRRMCDIANLRIRRLNRVAIGDVKLNGLATGKWRYLTLEEVQYLKKFS